MESVARVSAHCLDRSSTAHGGRLSGALRYEAVQFHSRARKSKDPISDKDIIHANLSAPEHSLAVICDVVQSGTSFLAALRKSW
jgi:hypothetical protein